MMIKFSNIKRITSLILCLLMIIPTIPNVLAASPSDFVDFPTGWSNEAVTAAVNNGLLNGRTANTIVPEGNLTRAEMATIINRAFGATIEKNISAFWDVPADAWYYHEIAKAYNMQTFQGDAAGTMRPEDFITREEVFAVIARALVLETSDYSSLSRFYDAGYISDWAKPYAAILVSKGYVNGDTSGNINPLANITREEFAQIMHNIVKTYYTVAGDYNYTGPSSSLIRSGNVTLSNVTIEGDLILGDGVGKGNVTLNNVTIKGRLLARGGEGKVTLTNTTVAGGVVVKDVNGIVNFNNYRKEAPFAGIREITKATFIGEAGTGGSVGGSTGGGGGGGGGGTPPAPVVPTPTKITITYNAMGGTVLPASTSIIPNGTISSLPTPTRTGYDFDGWYKNSSYTGDRVTTSTTFSSSTTIYAKWNIKKYNVTIDAPNGNDKNIEYEHGETIGDRLNFNELLPTGKTLEDYKFYNVATGDAVSSSTVVTSAMEIRFKEAKVVTYNYGYDNIYHTEKVFEGDKVGNKLHTPPARQGYDFEGWYTNGGTGSEFDEDTTVTTAIEVTAKWKAKEYTITYVSKTPQGTVIDFKTSFKNNPANYKFKSDTDFILPSDAEFEAHSDYEFDGWYLTSDASDTNKITRLTKETYFENVTLYARWILKTQLDDYVTVTVNLAPHAETYSFRQLKNTVLSSGELLNNNISKGKDKGYKLTNFTGHNFTQPLTANVTINPVWTPITYTIVYHIEDNGLIASDASFVGVSGRQDFNVTSGLVSLYTKANVSCTGIELVSWHKDSKDGPKLPEKINPDDYIGGREEIHVYAKWDWKKFTVNAYATTDPGAESYSFNDVVYNTTVGQLNIPTFTRRGYKYTKFSTTGTDSGNIYELTTPVVSDLTIYPLWEKEVYNITLVADAKNIGSSNGKVVFSDGTPDEQTRDFTIDVENGLPLELSSAVNFKNTDAYEFKGWYEAYDDTTKTFTGEITDGKIDSILWHNRTVYARWDVKTYTVNFVLSDGTISRTYEYGEELKYIPTREGYSFESWTSSLGDTLYTGARIYKNFTLTPNWTANTYYVNLNADPTGETGIEFAVASDARMSFTLDECPKALPDVSKFTGNEIYDFDGWYTSYNSITGEYTGKVNSVNGLSDKDRTYYAKWVKKSYTVYFNVDGIVTSDSREHGSQINHTVTKPGYEFDGWKDTTSGRVYNNEDVVAASLNLEAQWKLITYTVNLVADPKGYGDVDFANPSDASFKFNIEELTPKKALPVAFSFNSDKYTFDGWYQSSDGSGQKITDISSIHDAGKTFYAKWTKIPYTVTFDVYGSKTYYYDEVLGSDGVAGKPYEIEGYNRVEWNTANDGTGTTYTPDTEIKGDIVLFLYCADPKTYTITYEGKDTAFKFDNIPGYIPPESYTVESDITLPFYEVIVLSDGNIDYSRMFAGWYTDRGLTQKINNIPQGTTGNLTLYPKFIDVADWLVDFVDHDDWNIIYDVQMVYDRQPAQKPQPDPTKEGKKFIGWHYKDTTSAPTTLKPFDFNTPITHDTKLFAVWEDIEFTVYYKYPDKEVSSSGILYGDSLLQIIHENSGIPEKDGYFFIGWTLTEDSSTIDYYDDDVVTEEINGVLYPVWEPELYTIELYDNPTSIPGISPKDYSAIDNDFYITDLTGDGFKLPVAEDYNAPDEYEFKGWFENNLDGNRVTHITSISQANNKYYAKWVRKSFNVKYVYSDGQVPSDATIEYGDTLAILGTPVKKGYIHDGWENEYGDTYSIGHSVKEAIRGTLSPIWAPKTYTITLDADSQLLGATEKHPEQIVKTFTTDVIPVTLPLEDKYNAPEGYKFNGWYKEPGFVNRVTQIADIDQAETYTTYYAQWILKTFTVKYVSSDGQIASDAFSYGENLGKLPVPSKEGYKFKGWSLTDGASSAEYLAEHLSTYKVVSDMMLYPVWEKKVYTLEYTHNISVQEINPSLIKKEFTIDDVKDGGFDLPPENAYRTVEDGYTLKGWYTENTFDNKITKITNINQAGKYWANWVLKTYSVLVNSDGTPSEVTFTHNDTIGSKIKPLVASDGYEFKGWATTPDAKVPEYKQEDKVTKEFAQGTILYPVFTPKTLYLTYKYDENVHIWIGGENPQEFDVTKDVTLYDGSVFEHHDDWRFDGWYIEGTSTKLESFVKGTYTSDVTVEAKWTEIHHVTYNYGNYTGAPSVTKDVFAGSSAEIPTDVPDRSSEGWKFVEWQLNGARYDFANPVAADITLTAKWERIKYKVTFVVDGVETLTTTYEHDDKLSSNSAYSEPTKKGYKFDKWVDSDGKSVTSSGEVTSHLRLTAVWSNPIEYTLTYDVNGGPALKSEYPNDRTFDVTTPTFLLYDDTVFIDLTGYKFLGWMVDGEIVDKIEKGKYAKHITAVAQWQKVYYVSFDTDGGNPAAIDTQVVSDGSQATQPTDPTKTGYNFGGWINTSTSELYNFTQSVTSNISLKAKWNPIPYTVVLHNPDTGAEVELPAVYDADVTLKPQDADAYKFEKRGYHFDKWISSDATSVTYNYGDKVQKLTTTNNGRVILIASWAPNDYVIKFKANGGSGSLAEMNYKYNEYPLNLTPNNNAITRLGFTFLGWSLDEKADIESYSDGASTDKILNYMIDNGKKEVELFAIWREHTYYIEFNANGGNISMDKMELKYTEVKNLTLIDRNTFTRKGYSLKDTEWNVKSDGTGEGYEDGQPVSKLLTEDGATLTLYAQWKPISYTVKYDMGVTGSDVGTVTGSTADTEHTFDEPKALQTNGFIRTGYTFVGWTTEAPTDTTLLMLQSALQLAADTPKYKYVDGESVENLAETEGAIVTLYAVWRKNVYKVVYDANGADGTAPYGHDEVKYLEYITIADKGNLKMTGYHFTGWKDVDGRVFTAGEDRNDLSDKDNVTVTLYAQWDENTYTVEYNINGGKGTAPAGHENIKYSKQITIAAKSNFDREGYTFLGWAESANAVEAQYLAGDVKSGLTDVNGKRLTLYAVWQANKYKVRFDAGANNTVTDIPQNENYDNGVLTVTYDSVYPTLPKAKYNNGSKYFAGWKNKATGAKVSAGDAVKITANITLEAIWADKLPHTVKFADYNADGSAITQTVYNGNSIVEPPVPTRTGHTFGGWYKEATLQTPFEFEVLSSGETIELTAYPNWIAHKYTVKYDANGGSGSMPSQPFTFGVAANLTNNTYTKTGYRFNGWKDAAGKDYTDGQSVKDLTATSGGEVVLTAQWLERQFTVEFKANGAEGYTKELNFGYEDSDVELTEHGYDYLGFTFLGWSENANADAATYSDGAPKDKFIAKLLESTDDKLILYAIWSEHSYTVVFDANTGEGYMEPQTIKFTQEYTLPKSEFTKENHSFKEWNTKSDGTGTHYDAGDVISKRVSTDGGKFVLYAQWLKEVYGAKTITFIDRGVKKQISYNTSTDELGSKLGIIIPSDGYKLIGYNTSPDGDGIMYSDGTPVSEVTAETLYYIWEAIEYTITYDLDGGKWKDNAVYTEKYTVEDEIILSTDVKSETSKVFIGWLTTDPALAEPTPPGAMPTNPPPSGYYIIKKIPVGTTGNREFKAYWTGTSGTTYLTVTLMKDTTTKHMVFDILKDNTIASDGRYTEPEKDNYTFVGWSVKSDGTADNLYDISTPVTTDLTLYAVWKEIPVEKFTVTFYEGAYADEYTNVYEKEVNSGATISNDEITSILEENTWLYENPQEGYTDPETGVHKIPAELWYIASDGTWKIFDETVNVNSDMNVYYANKKMSFFFNNITIGDFSLTDQILFDVPYRADTRLMDTIKDAIARARVQVNDALANVDIYAQAIEKASEKSRDLLDENGRIKLVEIDTAISNIIKTEEIGGEIKKYIEKLVLDNSDKNEHLLESVIHIIEGSDFANDTFNGDCSIENVRSHINTLSEDERLKLAADIYNLMKERQDYKDFIEHFDAEHDDFIVHHDNLDFVMAVATAVSEYTYEELEKRIEAKFGKVIDILGEDVAKEFLTDAQKDYYEGAQALWTEMENNKSDAGYTTTYPSYLTFRINAIDHLFVPLFDKYREKVVKKLTDDNIYYYARNDYLRQLVEMDTQTDIIDKLLYKLPSSEMTDMDTGYALWPSDANGSGFMHYYDYFLDKLIIFDKAMLWYEENLTEEEFNNLRTKFYTQSAKALNKANEMLAAYEKDGSLPMGKNISDLMEIEAFAKVFNKVEDKIVKVLNKFKSTEFYGKEWTAQSVREDIPYAKLMEEILLGTDDPRFNLDSLMEHELIKKALNKAGFTDYDRSQTDEETGSVTIQAIERNIKGIEIKLARYYQ